MTPTLKTIAPGIWTVKDFFTPEECQHWIDFSEARGYEKAKIGPGRVQHLNLSVRNNDRVIYDAPDLADALWQRAQDFVPAELDRVVAMGMNTRFRFYRYHPGQQFRMHQDGSYIKNTNEWSEFTFMVYLNEGMKGGATRFREYTIVPRTGKLLIFNHQLSHEGEQLREGIKYVLRSDVMYRRKR
ncbi:2OG-Fe(II) oxygenase [Lewinella sp. W8]|uniref:2OG-Fe(II) oxygenase n=1 Tax=Lewinella sp. W8 TaxID=2528208 RepID=UPI0010673B2A|nr:2OG-Fe(II) oxygenase [Lewinella sp. W8]MTB50657.1 oxidoreductase, 2OG-Fe(II) oxygenase [Lewinella sp. W8]